MNSPVALILDNKMSGEVESFINKMPIWIVQTSENSSSVKRLRNYVDGRTLVTTFPRKAGESNSELFERVIYTLDDHHNEHSNGNPYDALVVSGLSVDDVKMDQLNDLGFSSLEQTDYGFIARKSADLNQMKIA